MEIAIFYVFAVGIEHVRPVYIMSFFFAGGSHGYLEVVGCLTHQIFFLDLQGFGQRLSRNTL